MNNMLKGLAVIVACALLFFASLTAIKTIGAKRDAGDFSKARQEENPVEETEDQTEEVEADEVQQGEQADASEGGIVDMQDVSKDFDNELISFLEESGYKTENYMVSPASLRAALALAVAGADSDTKTALLRSMGFEDENEMNEWYEKVRTAPDTSDGNTTFRLLDSAWHNTASKGTISDEYKKKIEDNYGAKAGDVSSDEITDKVNSWVNEGTEGLIPKISDDLSAMDLVLVNTLYLKSAWVNEFSDIATEEGDFTTCENSTVKKDFMQQTDYFNYYEDDDGKLIVMPMEGDVSAVFTLGNIDDISHKIEESSEEKVHVRLPKFEAENAFDKKEMSDFIKSRGADVAFTPAADFSVMSKDGEFYISDIVQMTKIRVDEDGIEAAAATAVMMLGSGLPGFEEEPKEFIADEPFRFYIVTNTDSHDVLFCGQIVK